MLTNEIKRKGIECFIIIIVSKDFSFLSNEGRNLHFFKSTRNTCLPDGKVGRCGGTLNNPN